MAAQPEAFTILNDLPKNLLSTTLISLDYDSDYNKLLGMWVLPRNGDLVSHIACYLPSCPDIHQIQVEIAGEVVWSHEYNHAESSEEGRTIVTIPILCNLLRIGYHTVGIKVLTKLSQVDAAIPYLTAQYHLVQDTEMRKELALHHPTYWFRGL
jgi:hypothetical protein